jgi:hypothetical protein
MVVETAAALEPHAFCEIFTRKSEGEYRALVAHMAAHGQLVEILIYQGKILDGLHRYRACLELGITPRTVEWDGKGSLVDQVIGRNIFGRNLTTSQRAMAAANLANLGRGRPVENAQICAFTIDQAAAKFDVTRRLVQDARKVKAQGVTGLAEAVDRGEVKVTPAAAVAGLEAEEQAKVVAGGAKAMKSKGAEIGRVKGQARSVGGRGREGSRSDEGRSLEIHAPVQPPVEAISEVGGLGVEQARTDPTDPATSGLPAAGPTDLIAEDLPLEMPDSTGIEGPEAAEGSLGPVAEPPVPGDTPGARRKTIRDGEEIEIETGWIDGGRKAAAKVDPGGAGMIATEGAGSGGEIEPGSAVDRESQGVESDAGRTPAERPSPAALVAGMRDLLAGLKAQGGAPPLPDAERRALAEELIHLAAELMPTIAWTGRHPLSPDPTDFNMNAKIYQFIEVLAGPIEPFAPDDPKLRLAWKRNPINLVDFFRSLKRPDGWRSCFWSEGDGSHEPSHKPCRECDGHGYRITQTEYSDPRKRKKPSKMDFFKG